MGIYMRMNLKMWEQTSKHISALVLLKWLLMAYQLFNPFNKKENDLKGHPVEFVYF